MLRDLISVAAMTLVVGGGALGAEYGGGSGTAEDPYQIWTAAGMNEIGLHPEDWDKHFALMDDIDLSGYSYSKALIGRYEGASYEMFTGAFDGGRHVISNLTIHGESAQCLGLFAMVGVGGRVSNLTLDDATVSGTGNPDVAGALAAVNLGAIVNCHANVNIIGEDVFGGLVGSNGFFFSDAFPSNPNAMISNCSATGCVAGMMDQSPCWIGGLVGSNSGIIERSWASCSVSGKDAIGGLVGANGGQPGPGGIIKDCYAGGSVVAERYGGGLVGHCGEILYQGGDVINCYAFGGVGRGEGYPKGGLAGTCLQGRVVGSFWDVEATGQDQAVAAVYDSSCMIEACGMTTVEMKAQSAFADSGWDFVGEDGNGVADVWRMCGDGVGYPRLSWEYSRGGDFACGDGIGMEDLVYLCERWLCAGEDAGAADSDGDGGVEMGDLGVMAAGWEADLSLAIDH